MLNSSEVPDESVGRARLTGIREIYLQIEIAKIFDEGEASIVDHFARLARIHSFSSAQIVDIGSLMMSDRYRCKLIIAMIKSISDPQNFGEVLEKIFPNLGPETKSFLMNLLK